MGKLSGYEGWEIVRSIGSGGFGRVYEIKKVDELGNEMHSALKVISVPEEDGEVSAYRDDGYDEESITTIFKNRAEDIAREFNLLSKLKGNSNIVSYEDHTITQHTGSPGWDICIRMELLTSLPEYYATRFSNGIAAESAVIRMGIDICRALELCGKYDIIHRDIKPQNIFVNDLGSFKLGDFGTAKTSDHTTKATKTGTYGYMAPEVYMAQPYNASVDIYSLGLVMYWMLNERRGPFLPYPPTVPRSIEMEEALGRRISGEALPVPRHGSKALQSIVLKACQFNPLDRWKDATEMRKALEALETGGNLPNLFEEAEEKTVGVYGGPVRSKHVVQKENATLSEETVGIFDRGSTKNTHGGKRSVDKKRKARWAIGLAAVFAVAVLGGALFAFSRNEPMAPPPVQEQNPIIQSPVQEKPMQEEVTTPTNIVVEGQCTDTVAWTLSKDGVLTISGSGSMGDWMMDSETNLSAYNVTSLVVEDGVTDISMHAFSGSELTNARIAGSVRTINSSAFFLVDTLTNIELSEGLTEIKSQAFSGTGIKNLTLPATVQTCALDMLFSSSVEWIDVANGSKWVSKDGVLYSKDETTLLLCPPGYEGVFVVSEGVTEIGNSAFRTADISKIIFPESLQTIGGAAFEFCNNLTEVNIPANVTEIGAGVFAHCANLQNITVDEANSSYRDEDGVLYIKPLAGILVCFPAGRDGLATICPGTAGIAESAFAGCMINEIYFPESVTHVFDWAFGTCHYLETIYYKGSQEQWSNVNIGAGNDYLIDCVIHCNFTE